jgi:DNA-binding MarR family transcriptional regulator
MTANLSTSPHTLVGSAIAVGRHLESELEEVLAAHRLSLQSFFVLGALASAPERTLTQKQLVSAAGRTAGTTSVRLHRLQRAGLIERSRADEDARLVRVRLTDAGAELHERAAETCAQAATRLTAPLGDHADELGALLGRWLEFFAPAHPVARRLGVVVATAAVADRMRRAVGLPAAGGLLVLEVEDGSPAAAAGLEQGDLIQTLDDEPVHSTGDLERALERAGDRARAGVLRGVQPRAVEVSF